MSTPLFDLWTLRAAGLQWLRYTRMCPLVAVERGPVDGVPDLLGMDRSRRVTEIEIKRSRSDFRADREKRKHLWARPKSGPNWFYFLVPTCMADWAVTELREGEGLLKPAVTNSLSGAPDIEVVRRATRRHSEVLPVWALRTMALAQSGTLVSLAAMAARVSVERRAAA